MIQVPSSAFFVSLLILLLLSLLPLILLSPLLLLLMTITITIKRLRLSRDQEKLFRGASGNKAERGMRDRTQDQPITWDAQIFAELLQT